MAQPRLICLLLALLTLLLYLPVRQHGFIVYDDNLYVTENRMVQQGLSWAGVKWAFTTLHASNWHPVTWLSHMLDWELFGGNAGAHHLVNVLFHVANTLLLFLLLRRMTVSLWASALVRRCSHGIRCTLSPWHGSPSARMCSARFSGCWRCMVTFCMRARATWRAYFCSLLCFALGLMAKPMLVTLPFCFSAPGLLAAEARAWFSAPRGGEVPIFSADCRFLRHHGDRATGGGDG
jgi:hypothetical protein